MKETDLTNRLVNNVVIQDGDVSNIVKIITEKLDEELRRSTSSYIEEKRTGGKNMRFDGYQKQEITKKILSIVLDEGLSLHQAELVLETVKEKLNHVRLGKEISITYD